MSDMIVFDFINDQVLVRGADGSESIVDQDRPLELVGTATPPSADHG